LDKLFITAEQLERESWQFAIDLHGSGHRFDWVVGVARGGAQISIYMQEAFCLLRGEEVNYAAVQAWSYTAIGKAEDRVCIRNLPALVEAVGPGQSILVVDDVFDRGTTLCAIRTALSRELGGDGGKVVLGALYWKPENNQTEIAPDFHHRSCPGDQWLVFPHELCGLTRQELAAKNFPVEKLGVN
jgi:hypothetical protein